MDIACVSASICYRSLGFDLISEVLLTMLMEMKWEGDERLRAGGSEERDRSRCR